MQAVQTGTLHPRQDETKEQEEEKKTKAEGQAKREKVAKKAACQRLQNKQKMGQISNGSRVRRRKGYSTGLCLIQCRGAVAKRSNPRNAEDLLSQGRSTSTTT